MKKQIAFLLIVFFVFNSRSNAAKILGFFPTDTYSHFIFYNSLMVELAKRGHEVTVVSHFPQDFKMINFEEIGLNGSLVIPTMNIDEMLKLSHIGNELDVISICMQACEVVLNHPDVLKILNRNFDLFLTEIFATDCFLSIGQTLGVPAVGLISSVTLPWVNDMVANPDNPSYIPSYFLPFTQNMNILQRTYNTIMNIAFKLLYKVHSHNPSQEIIKRNFDSLPPLQSMIVNYSLILVNSHFSINQVRPIVPQIVEVGGMHIPKTKNILPQDLEWFLDESQNGVIYFSLGSYAPVETIPEKKLQSIINVFGSLKQNILWKANFSSNIILPKNIKTGVWMPQYEVLCHPNVKLFIGHGGLLGMQEAVTCGVPILGIPLFADQALNLAQCQESGFAKVLEYENINQETLSKAIEEILITDSYTEKAKHFSSLFKDRPMHPMDTAAYWIEYILKYNGASHLRSPALNLKWYQVLLLDIGLVILLFVMLFVTIIYFLSKNVFYIIRYITCNLYEKNNNSKIAKNKNINVKND